MTLKIYHAAGLEDSYYEEFACDKAVKDTGNRKITLYENSAVTYTFSGVRDFSVYTLTGGSWSDPDPSPTQEQLRADVDYCMMLLGEETE